MQSSLAGFPPCSMTYFLKKNYADVQVMGCNWQLRTAASHSNAPTVASTEKITFLCPITAT